MNHIDEGTIHAWLDGALGAERAREVEAHVATCGECSAAVAEARGLIAGASRILTALDDVPAGVTPKRAPAPKRQWRAAPWVTGIAAALILAVGVTTWNREGVRMASTDQAALLERDSVVPETAQSLVVAAPPAAAPTTVTPPVAEGAASLRKEATAPRRQSDAREERSAEARKRDDGRAAAGAVVADRPRTLAAAADSVRGNEREQAQVGSVVGARDSVRLRMLARAPTLLSETVVTSAPSPGALRDASIDANQAAGCYQVSMGVTEQKGAAAEPSVTANRTAAREGAAARAPRPVAPSAGRADFAATRIPLIQLDTVRIGGALVVRAVKDVPAIADVSPDSTLGRWEPISTDSLRVRFSSGRFLTLARSARTRCPER